MRLKRVHVGLLLAVAGCCGCAVKVGGGAAAGPPGKPPEGMDAKAADERWGPAPGRQVKVFFTLGGAKWSREGKVIRSDKEWIVLDQADGNRAWVNREHTTVIDVVAE